MPHNPPKERVFVVGAPRSGTTMVQGILNAHSAVHSFPESHFYSFLFRDLHHRRYGFAVSYEKPLWRLRVGLLWKQTKALADKPRPLIQHRIDIFLAKAGLEHYKPYFDSTRNTITALSNTFIEVLDGEAWKSDLGGRIRPNASKYESVFSSGGKQLIEERLRPLSAVDIECARALRAQ